MNPHVLFLFVLVMLLTGCQPPQLEVAITLTSQPSPTGLPTMTPLPGLITSPTYTIVPTIAPSATTTVSSTPPMTRSVAYAFDSGQGQLVAFGGTSDLAAGGCSPCGETWVSDGTNWVKLEPVHSPPPRTGAVMIYDDNRRAVMLFGGAAPLADAAADPNYQAYNDTWLWDGQDWNEVPTEDAPPPRFNAHMALDAARQEIVLFGGYGPNIGRGELHYFIDTWTWDGKRWKEHDVPGPGNGAIPPPSMTYAYGVLDQVVLWQIGSGLWTWDGAAWHNLPHTDNGPGRFTEGQIIFDFGRGHLLLRGVDTEEGPHTVKTWTWDGQQWKLIRTDPDDQYGYYQDAALVYDTVRRVPLYITPSGGKFEPSRLRLFVWTGSAWVNSAGYWPPPPLVSDSGNILLTSNRTDLAICVDTADPSARPRLAAYRDTVQAALDDHLSHDTGWSKLRYDQFAYRVEAGCPSGPILTGLGVSAEIPSPYRLHLYVVDQETIHQSFAGGARRYLAHELLCERDNCAEVTTALYLTDQEMQTPIRVQNELAHVLSLSEKP